MNAGYLNNDAATAVAWRNGWFHTGDALVRTTDGDYIFVDRLKDVIRRGERTSRPSRSKLTCCEIRTSSSVPPWQFRPTLPKTRSYCSR